MDSDDSARVFMFVWVYVFVCVCVALFDQILHNPCDASEMIQVA